MRIIWMYISFFVMIAMNTLANALPLNDVTTGEVSQKYPVLFTPSGYVFTIWGLIYLLLLIWLIGMTRKKAPLTDKLAKWFIISCFLNALWIFVWHFEWVTLSLIVIVALCYVLGRFYFEQKTVSQKKFQLPIAIYFAWVTVASFANFSYLFHAFSTNSFLGLSEASFTILLLIIGLVIALTVCYRQKDFLYPLVFIFAYFGIFTNDLSLNTSVAIVALILSIVLLIITFMRFKKLSSKF